MYNWDFKTVWNHRAQLFGAVLDTLELNGLVLLVGTVIGVLLGLTSRNRSKALRVSARIYTDLFRTLPVLVLLVWFFYCVPILLGIRMSAFAVAAIVLSLNLSAFTGEIVRAGVEAVPQANVDDAAALGLSRRQTNRWIVLPVALRLMIPPLVGQYINTVKLSVLASVIAVPELLHTTYDLISQTYRPLEFYTVLSLLFLILLLPGTLLSRYLEARVARMIGSKAD